MIENRFNFAAIKNKENLDQIFVQFVSKTNFQIVESLKKIFFEFFLHVYFHNSLFGHKLINSIV